jgi:hypothetical protein
MGRWHVGIATLLLLACAGLHPASAIGSDEPWHVETIDGNNGHIVGYSCSLAIDRFGNFHIASWDKTDNAVRYAFRGKTDNRWYTMEVDQRAGTFLSLAVDAKGYPSIAYNSMFETGLHYAHWDGANWKKLLIDPIQTDHFLSLQMDAAGNPHISYYREVYPDMRIPGQGYYALYLKYAYFDGKTWYIQTVDHRFGTGKFNSLALDAQGRPFIAYTDIHPGDLDYAYWSGKQWEFGIVDARSTNGNSYVGIGNSDAIDSKGNPHIAYYDTTKLLIKYAWRANGIWKTEVVDQMTGSPEILDHLSLVLDKQDHPHIAYYDPSTGTLKYAFRDEKGWHVDAIVKTDHVIAFPSLALDPEGNPYIAYYDANEGALQFAYRVSGASKTTGKVADGRRQ